MSRRSRAWLVVLSGLVVIFALLGTVVDIWTEWLWFDEVSATQVFTGQLSTRIALFAVFAVVIGGFLFGNLFLAYKLRPFLPPTGIEQQALERYRYLLGPRLYTWFAVAAGTVALFAGLAAQGRWQQWMLFSNAEPFGETDPQFGTDIGFYIFKLPFWQYLLNSGFVLVVLALIGSLAVHYLYGGVRLAGPGDRMTTGARAHLTTLVAVFVLLKAVAYALDQRAMLLGVISDTGLTGAGYSDINALLTAKEMLMYISIIVAIAILVFSNAVIRNLVWPGVALALLIISAIAIGGVYPWGVQTFNVDPSRLTKEREFIQRNIDATLKAYNLTDVEISGYTADTTVPPASLAEDNEIVPSIRLLDPAVVNESYTQLSQVRSFYSFGDKLDIDRYTVNGETRDYVVGARELDYGRLPQDNWLTRHTIYTHGYGFVAAPANRTVCGGQPFFVSGFFDAEFEPGEAQGGERCSSPADLLPVQQPRIYYGERMGTYAIVGKSEEAQAAEYDRPSATGDVRFTYTGAGGVPIGSFGRKLLYSIKFGETNFILSDAVNDASKVLYDRHPRTRVEKVAPFLTVDGDPYPVALKDRIVWIVDGYTTAGNYPYAQRVDLRDATSDALTGAGTFALARQDINYIRNSVKAVVDAYDGTVTLYEFDDADPVLKVWNKAFGGDLITPKSDTPAELAEHFRYPADLFKVQRDLITRYHVRNSDALFSGEDFWAVPNDPADNNERRQPPYYLHTKLPTQEEERFQLTAALTPAERQNMAALVSGSYDNGEPKLLVLELKQDSRIPGPGQAQQKMENTDSVRTQLNIWGQDVLKGNLLSLPYAGGMLYVEPIYLRSSTVDRPYPLMKKVLLNYGDRVAFADTLDLAIKQLTSGSPPPPPTEEPGEPGEPGEPAPSGDVAAAAAKLNQAIADLRAAQQSGDFEAYGRALAALEVAVNEYQAAQAAANPGASPAPSPTG